MVEAIPAVVLGIIVVFWMADWPAQANWLDPQEKKFLAEQYAHEQAAKAAVKNYNVGQALFDPEVWKLCLAYFLWITVFWGFTYWMPSVLKELSGWSNAFIGQVFAAAMLVSLVASAYTGHSSSKRNEKRWHGALHMFLAAIAIGAGAFVHAPWPYSLLMTMAAVGTYAPMSVWWSYPTTFLSGSAAAGAIGLINSMGNLGGFAGPYITGWIKNTTGSFDGAMVYLSLSLAAAGLLMLTMRRRIRENSIDAGPA